MSPKDLSAHIEAARKRFSGSNGLSDDVQALFFGLTAVGVAIVDELREIKERLPDATDQW